MYEQQDRRISNDSHTQILSGLGLSWDAKNVQKVIRNDIVQ